MTRWGLPHRLKSLFLKNFQKPLLTSRASYVLLGEKHSHKQKTLSAGNNRNVSTQQGAYHR